MFFLLTIMKDEKLHANVYTDKESLVNAIETFKPLPLRLFLLTPTEDELYDVCLINIGPRYIVGLGSKGKIKNDDTYTKCNKKEIDINEVI